MSGSVGQQEVVSCDQEEIRETITGSILMVNISRHWPEIRRDVHLTHQVVCYTDIHPDNSDWTDHLSISVYHGLTDATAATLTSNPIQATPTADISPRRSLIGLSTVLEATDVIREMWSWRRSLFHPCFHSSAASCLVHTALLSWRLQSVTEKLQAQSQFVLTLCLMLALTLTWEPEKAQLSFNYLLIILTSESEAC